MSITKERVLAALSTVQDPDLKQDLVTLGMIDKLQVHEKTISFVVILTTPACPLKEYLRQECVRALEEAFGEGLNLDIHMSSRVTSTRANAPLLPQVKNIIAVASGKGGVGKSTVTANLAVALAKTGAKVGVVDADIFGPSQHIMFNCEHEQPGIEQEQGKSYIIPIEQYGVKLISIGLLTPADHAIVWRGPMASQALKQFLGEARWGELDYLLIDLPPGTSDIHLTLVQTVPVTGAVVVTTPQKVAVSDARKGLSMFKQPQINVPILGVVENMAYFTPAELPDNKYYIFGREGGRQMAEKYGVPFLGEVPLVQSIRESGDSGYPAVLKDDPAAEAFQAIAETLARQIAIRNANAERTKVVDVQ